MKLTAIFLTLFASISISTAQKQLRAYVDNKQFYAPGIGNYVEFNFQFVGYSLAYTGVEGGLIADVLVETSVQNSDSIVASNAYRLSSPLMRDSIIEDFFDLQRYKLLPGEYEFHIRLTDLNTTNEALTAAMPILVEDMGDAISLSDIEVAEIATAGDPNSIFFKSGYNIIPRISTFYPEQLDALPVYMEVYNSTLFGDSTFRIKQSIIDAQSGDILKEFEMISEYSTSDVVPVFRKIQLDRILTGTYVLKYTILSDANVELATQLYEFERSNDQEVDLFAGDIIVDPMFQSSIPEDSVGYYLESLIPISKANEVKNIVELLKGNDGDAVRKFIQQYWLVTAGINAYDEWLSYKRQVQFVEKIYANNFQEGFETDRGRVYLQYGSPTNIINREVSNMEYPYEIWQYNKIGAFSNKRFIFYNPDLVNNTYRLLHSDMIGELKNSAWQQELSKRNTRNGDVDNPNSHVIDKWGQNSLDDFRQY